VPLSPSDFSTSFDNSRITLDSGRVLSLRVEGSGDPPIILLHGLNSHSGTWRKNIGVLVKKRRVIAPSLPPWQGTIQSVRVEEYAALVEELIAKENFSSKVTLIGNSLGGWIGMKVAHMRPRIIDSLLLEDSAGVNKNEETMLHDIDSSQIPVCIIWGREDEVVPVEAARYLHSRLQKSSLLIFENVGHVPHWEKPDEFNEAVYSFLGLN
jgi:pimeloyl-ACP methyl ester carboxylesterase